MAKDSIDKVLQQAQTPVTIRSVKDGLSLPTEISTIGSVEPIQYEGGEVTIGIAAVEITFSGLTRIIYIQADSANAGSIWLGKSNLTNTANRMIRLNAGESVEISLNDISDALYAVSDRSEEHTSELQSH